MHTLLLPPAAPPPLPASHLKKELALATSTVDLSPRSETAATRPPTPRANILFFFAIILFLAVAWQLLKELEILYVSALFAVVLTPVIDSITNLNLRGYKPSRPIAILILVAVIALGLTVFFTLGLPPVLRDLHNFLAELPKRIPAFTARLERFPLAQKFGVSEISARAENAAAAVGAYIFTSIPLWLAHVFDLLTAVFLCIYFMLDGANAYHFFLSFFPADKRRRLDVTLQRAETKMSKWLIGQGLLMLILGVCSIIVFGFLHLRYFFLLGVLMGLLNLIPIAGGVITICLAALVAALDSWGKMAGVLIFYAIYINLENVYLTPRIMRSSVNLMGLTILVSLLIGTALAGVVGALVAVPTAALISVLLEEYAVRR